MQPFLAFLAALTVTMVMIPPLMRWAGTLQILDTPNERKVHDSVVPRVGGIAMVMAALLAVMVVVPLGPEIIALLVSISILLIFGIWDDRSDLDYRIKFFGQFLAVATVVFFGHVLISRLPLTGFNPSSIYITVPFTIFFLVGVTNAFNLADGLDGLAAGITLLSLAAIALLAYMANDTELLPVIMAVMGSIVGFLRYNTYPARVFMGDTGSQFLGISAGIVAVILTQRTNTALSAALPLLLLGLPILDTVMVIGMRLWEGRSPFSADSRHIHHKLLKLGFDHYEAVVIIYLIQASFIACAIFLRYESDELIITLFAGICCGLLALLWWATRSGWKVRAEGEQPRFHHLIKAASRNGLVYQVPLVILRYSIPALLLVSVLFVKDVPPDLGFAACIVFVLMLLRLIYGYRLWFLYLRLMVFVTVAFVVYLTGVYPAGIKLFPQGYEYVYYGILVSALLIAIRYSKKEVFQLNPTDFLTVILVFGIAVIPHEQLLEYNLVQSIVKMAILFYGSEFILQRMESRWNLFTGSVLVTLGVLGLRGFIL